MAVRDVMEYSNECAYCGDEFTVDNPCWNDNGTHENGSHLDGECKRCASKCRRNQYLWDQRIWDGKSAGGGTLKRGE
jgi:hypothetical protein